jgi:hypothetical protein
MARDRAKAVLLNYFQAIARHAGMAWQRDYTVEIESVVDDIIEAATPPAPSDTEHVEALKSWGDMREKSDRVVGADPRD